ncbi:hypothetical protein KEM52_003115 [Ascosphaera acerosa]|nr:hypothetical protein KEM52_003115 [Ascosphaera acerosa]
MNGDLYSSRDSGRSRDYYSGRSERRDRGERSDRDRERTERGGERGERRERDRGERRRSRSPHGSSSYRRREADSYSASRDMRAREREDRYTRRDDRDIFDKDRRRDHRRDEDRDRRGERDLFDERPRRRDRDRDRDRDRERERKRSATPPPRKREPTPDLTDVVPILERKRRLTQWDIKPPGYENVSAEQAKLSGAHHPGMHALRVGQQLTELTLTGMFPLPGAPRQQQVDPSRLRTFMDRQLPPHPAAPSNNVTLKASNARAAKRLFVENLPAEVTEENLVRFFNLQLNGLNVTSEVDPCVSAQFSKDKALGMVEFKAATDATVALAFDGIQMEEHAAQGEGVRGLALRRPKDYIVPPGDDRLPAPDGSVSSDVPDSPSKICVSNIPSFIPEDQVTDLLVAFGPLKAFVLVKDSETGESRGIAFCEYVDPSTTSIVLEHLNGMELSDVKLKLQLASVGSTQAPGLEMNVTTMSVIAQTTSQDLETGRVLQLLNMVTPEELMDNDDYEEILEDVQDECSKFGTILEIKIPRPTSNLKQSAGVGKIFIKYENVESAEKALRALAGRKFSDRTVVCSYFSEENFDVGAW